MKKLKDKNDLDGIVEYLQDDTGLIVIDGKTQDKLDRINFADNCINLYNAPKNVIPMLMKKFDISESTAWRDLAAAQYVFGSIGKTQKEYWRKTIINFAMYAIALARAKKDIKGLNAGILNLIKATGIDKDDPEMPDFSKFEQHNYQIVISEELTRELLKMTLSGSVNLSDIRENSLTGGE